MSSFGHGLLFDLNPAYADLVQRGVLSDEQCTPLVYMLHHTYLGGNYALTHTILANPATPADLALAASMPAITHGGITLSALDLLVFLIASPDSWHAPFCPESCAPILAYITHRDPLVDTAMPFDRVMLDCASLMLPWPISRDTLIAHLPHDPTLAQQLLDAYDLGTSIPDRPLDRLTVSTLVRYGLMRDDYLILLPHDAQPTDRTYVLYGYNMEHKIYACPSHDDPIDGDYDIWDMPDTVSGYIDAIIKLIGHGRLCGYLSRYGD